MFFQQITLAYRRKTGVLRRRWEVDVNPLDSAETAADLLQSLFGLEGKVVVVTGGGTGLGRETARLFAGAGATVIVADLDVSKARHVADEASVAALFEIVRDELGGATIFVNNARIYPIKPLLEISAEDWSRVLDNNLKEAFLCTRAAVIQMQAGGRGGRIVNISSIASVHPALKG